MDDSRLKQKNFLGVLPGLSETINAKSANTNTSATINDDLGLVSFRGSHYKPIPKITEEKFAAENNTISQVAAGDQALVHRIENIEELTKNVIKELKYLRTGGSSTYQLMNMVSESNEVISQLSKRLRKTEEKLHIEKENSQDITKHISRIKKSLHNTQLFGDNQHSTVMSCFDDLYHRLQDISCRFEGQERRLEDYQDQIRYMTKQLESQALQLQKFHSSISLDESRTLDLARVDHNHNFDQHSKQLRDILESKYLEVQQAISMMTKQLSQSNSQMLNHTQQIDMKIANIQTSMRNIHQQVQDDLKNLKSREQEREFSRESEKLKLQNIIQTMSSEWNEKRIQKEIELREELFRKLNDSEKLKQEEEQARINFEISLKEEMDSRLQSQQRLANEEVAIMKEARKTDRTRLASNFRKVQELIIDIANKISCDRKSIDKVILAEIQKREEQAQTITNSLSLIQEQLRIGLSSFEETVSNLKTRIIKDKNEITNQLKIMVQEEDKLSHLRDQFDEKFKSVKAKMIEAEIGLDGKIDKIKSDCQLESIAALKKFNLWKESTSEGFEKLQEDFRKLMKAKKEIEQQIIEMKNDSEKLTTLECSSRLRQAKKTENELIEMQSRIEELEVNAERSQNNQLTGDQFTIEKLQEEIFAVRSMTAIQISSETKMRLEETSFMKHDIAQLCAQVKPLLWRQYSFNRKFIKQQKMSLNHWGVYQCFRWYIIKMKWLRLLAISKIRRENPSLFPSRLGNYPPEMADYQFDLNEELEGEVWNSQFEEMSEPQTNFRENDKNIYPLSEDERSDVELIDASEGGKKWYNKDVVLPNEPINPSLRNKSVLKKRPKRK